MNESSQPWLDHGQPWSAMKLWIMSCLGNEEIYTSTANYLHCPKFHKSTFTFL